MSRARLARKHRCDRTSALVIGHAGGDAADHLQEERAASHRVERGDRRIGEGCRQIGQFAILR